MAIGDDGANDDTDESTVGRVGLNRVKEAVSITSTALLVGM